MKGQLILSTVKEHQQNLRKFTFTYKMYPIHLPNSYL